MTPTDELAMTAWSREIGLSEFIHNVNQYPPDTMRFWAKMVRALANKIDAEADKKVGAA
jgi:hypothetical protein